MKVVEVMSRDIQPVSPQESVQGLAETMAELDVSALPVAEGDRLVGIVTERDITIRVVAQGRDPTGATAADIMSSTLVCCRESDDAAVVAEQMRQRQIRQMPVLDSEDRLLGMVRMSDIVEMPHPDVMPPPDKAPPAPPPADD